MGKKYEISKHTDISNFLVLLQSLKSQILPYKNPFKFSNNMVWSLDQSNFSHGRFHIIWTKYGTLTSVPGKWRVLSQKPDGNRYLTRHWRKRQSAKVLL